jgi:hypothetical protein
MEKVEDEMIEKMNKVVNLFIMMFYKIWGVVR